MKKIISFIIGMILLMGIALAQPVPAPITFKVSVNGYSINYKNVEVLNTRTGEKLTPEKVNSLEIIKGIGFFDLQEFELGYQIANPYFNYAGDKLDVRVCDVHPSCTFSLYITTRDPIQNTFKIKIVDEAIVKEKYLYQCSDNSWVVSQNDCPIKVTEPIITKYVCPDGKQVSKASECVLPEEEEISDLWKGLIALAIIILAAFGWGKGFTALASYYFNKGKELEKQGKKAEAKKYYERSSKMLVTAFKKAKEGKYKK